MDGVENGGVKVEWIGKLLRKILHARDNQAALTTNFLREPMEVLERHPHVLADEFTKSRVRRMIRMWNLPLWGTT